MVLLEKFKKSNINLFEYAEVSNIANELYEYFKNPAVIKKLEIANKPGKNSKEVQDVFIKKAKELGFVSEKKGLFSNIPTSNLRPDYYCGLKKSGILIEVERGKTLTNNMDLLDIWKCHLCDSANHLFLFVPRRLTHNKDSKPYDSFKVVIKRMKPFFEKPNYINVSSLWLFGY
jgi:hypothetical protein